jgi:hypothetical protein
VRPLARCQFFEIDGTEFHEVWKLLPKLSWGSRAASS